MKINTFSLPFPPPIITRTRFPYEIFFLCGNSKQRKIRRTRRSEEKKKEKLSFRSQGSEGKIIMCLFLTIFTSEALERNKGK